MLCALAATAGAAEPEDPSGPRTEFLRGMALGLFSREDPEHIRASLDELQGLGVGAISLVVPKTIRDVRSAEFRDRAAVTPTDAVVIEAIRQARARGMQVMLFPTVFVRHLEDGEWRGTLDPPDWDVWFRNYGDVILHYARMGEAEGVDLLSVGSELCSSEGLESHWRRLIARVRRVYRGRLIYSANWDHFREVSFGRDLDYLGVNAYYHLTDDPRPEVEPLLEAWGPVRESLRAWARDHGRPLLITEVGYPSREGAGTDPWDYRAERPASPEAQRRCYRAFIEAWSDTPELAGVFFYMWWGDGGPDDRDYTPRDKPAAGEMARWFGRIAGKGAGHERWEHEPDARALVPGRAAGHGRDRRESDPGRQADLHEQRSSAQGGHDDR